MNLAPNLATNSCHLYSNLVAFKFEKFSVNMIHMLGYIDTYEFFTNVILIFYPQDCCIKLNN